VTERERRLIVELVKAAEEIALRKRRERDQQRRKLRVVEGEKAA